MLCSIYARFPFSFPLIKSQRESGRAASIPFNLTISKAILCTALSIFSRFVELNMWSNLRSICMVTYTTIQHTNNLGWIVASLNFEIHIVSLSYWASWQHFNTQNFQHFWIDAKGDDNEDIFLSNDGDSFFLLFFHSCILYRSHDTSFTSLLHFQVMHSAGRTTTRNCVKIKVLLANTLNMTA